MQNKIVISKKEINFVQTLECGQIFSYKKHSDFFEIFSADKYAKVVEKSDCFEVLCDDKKYWENFFDLQTDYEEIKSQLQKFDILEKPIEYGNGIRILRQDVFEIIISFVVSANNNIKRITKTLFELRKRFGKNMGSYFAFPTLSELEKITETDLIEIGTGYRAKQIIKLLGQLKSINLEDMKKLETLELRNRLIELSGIGPKVADCILLFGFSRTDVFPVDTWIEKVYNDFFLSLKNRIEIRKNLVKKFGNLSGYAQQYLFYYKRENKII